MLDMFMDRARKRKGAPKIFKNTHCNLKDLYRFLLLASSIFLRNTFYITKI